MSTKIASKQINFKDSYQGSIVEFGGGVNNLAGKLLIDESVDGAADASLEIKGSLTVTNSLIGIKTEKLTVKGDCILGDADNDKVIIRAGIVDIYGNTITAYANYLTSVKTWELDTNTGNMKVEGVIAKINNTEPQIRYDNPEGITITNNLITDAIDRIIQNLDFLHNYHEDTSANGSKIVFTVPDGAYRKGTLIVYKNGAICRKIANPTTSMQFKEINPTSGTFEFGSAPPSGDILILFYARN